jgi:hypothetical protein
MHAKRLNYDQQEDLSLSGSLSKPIARRSVNGRSNKDNRHCGTHYDNQTDENETFQILQNATIAHFNRSINSSS